MASTTNKQKICFVVSDYKGPWSEAIKNNSRDLINRLKHKYDFFCISPSDHDGFKVSDGVPTYFVKSPLFLTKFKRVFYAIGLIRLMLKSKKIIQKENPDLIVTNLESPSVGFVGKALKRHTKNNANFVQIVNSVHYSPQKSPLTYWLMDELPQVFFNNKFFYKLGLKKADKNIIVSQILKRNLDKMGVKNYSLVPYGVDLKKFKPSKKSKSKDFKIGYLGHLIYAKGGSLLLDAFSKLPGNIDSKLLLATTWGSEEGILNNLDKKRVVMHGIMKNQQDFYNKCDLFVLPLRYSFSTLSTPQVILEAQACGIPVLGSDLENIADIIEDNINGYLFKSNDAESLLSRIKEIHANKDKMKLISKKAKDKIISKYSWDVLIDSWDKEFSNGN